MSSNMYLINWTAETVTPTLNQQQLSPALKAAKASDSYFPYQMSISRNAAQPPQPGKWGDVNSLSIKPSGSGSTQVYNNLNDPTGAAPNTTLYLWILPEYVVFSQLDGQLGEPHYPS